MLDALVVAVVLLFVLLGFLRGILHGGLVLCALGVAYLASGRLEAPFGSLLLSLSQLRPAVAYTLGRVLGGVLVYASLRVAVSVADRRIGRTRHGVLQPWNRNLGAVVGLVFGAGLGLCLLCLAGAAQGSYLRRLVSPHNPADRLLVTDSLRVVSAARRDPEMLAELEQEDVFRRLAEHPTVRAILEDEELMDAIRRQDIVRVARDEKIRSAGREDTQASHRPGAAQAHLLRADARGHQEGRRRAARRRQRNRQGGAAPSCRPLSRRHPPAAAQRMPTFCRTSCMVLSARSLHTRAPCLMTSST